MFFSKQLEADLIGKSPAESRHILLYYLRLRYKSTKSARHVKKSGSIAKGPRPKARNPKAHCKYGLDVRV